MRMIKQYQGLFVLIAGVLTAFNVMLVNAATLATANVSQSGSASVITVEGVVEAVQSSVIAPQVAGSITTLPVKVGDYVKAGQLLARIDTRLATQQALTSQAQVSAG